MTTADIQNQALSRIGEPAQVANTPAAAAITLHYAFTVQELQRAHRWNFLLERVMLEPDWTTPSAIADNGSGEFRISSTAHGLATGDRVTFDGSEDFPGTNYQGIQSTWTVTVINANTFDLDDSIFYGSGTVDARYALAGRTRWKYSIAAPSDMLRALDDDNNQNQSEPRWVFESGRILTDCQPMEFHYLRDETDAAVYTKDPLFVSALVLRLAIKIITHLRGDGTPTQQSLEAELQRVVAPLARRIDAAESRSRKRLMPAQSGFVSSRFGWGSYNWYARWKGYDLP